MKKSMVITPVLLWFIFMNLALLGQQQRQCRRLQVLKEGRAGLPTGYNELFAGSGECLLCHNDMVNASGEPIGILNDWRSSMMANSSKDPLWRAKVSHETLVNPAHAEALEDVCTRCHAPMGHFNAHFLGQTNYGINEMVEDSLALDGVSCTLCHQMTPESLGAHSGELLVGSDKQIWGPYPNPFTFPMFNNTGYTPGYSDHITDSRLCGACHTLLTNSVDLEGNLTGEQFVEQAVFHEWLNSDYPQQGKTCQQCHIPRIDDTVKVSLMPPWLEGRSPFGLHHLAGGNKYMKTILKENIEELGITATATQFDSTIARTLRMLQQETALLEVEETRRASDTIFLEISVENLAGHKFPSGFPSRRAFLEIVIMGAGNDTLFHSGKMDGNHQLIDEDIPFEQHHYVITDDEQVQVYEMVMGDVNGDLTTVLERGYQHLKDNRLPPAGFTTGHTAYDTVEIAGNALQDDNFNKDDDFEGTGRDILFVHAPIDGYTGEVTVITRLHYQTVSSRWLDHMFSFSSAGIDAWQDLYQESDKTPVLVAESTLTSNAVQLEEGPLQNRFHIYPNPSGGKLTVTIHDGSAAEAVIYSMGGTKMAHYRLDRASNILDLDDMKGVFLLTLLRNERHELTKKIIVR